MFNPFFKRFREIAQPSPASQVLEIIHHLTQAMEKILSA